MQGDAHLDALAQKWDELVEPAIEKPHERRHLEGSAPRWRSIAGSVVSVNWT